MGNRMSQNSGLMHVVGMKRPDAPDISLAKD
jgi:hypothetical protein